MMGNIETDQSPEHPPGEENPILEDPWNSKGLDPPGMGRGEEGEVGLNRPGGLLQFPGWAEGKRGRLS